VAAVRKIYAFARRAFMGILANIPNARVICLNFISATKASAWFISIEQTNSNACATLIQRVPCVTFLFAMIIAITMVNANIPWANTIIKQRISSKLSQI